MAYLCPSTIRVKRRPELVAAERGARHLAAAALQRPFVPESGDASSPNPAQADGVAGFGLGEQRQVRPMTVPILV
jgi:hypothetical protein